MYQSVEYGNEQLMMRMRRKKRKKEKKMAMVEEDDEEEEEEMKQQQQPEEEEHCNSSSTTNKLNVNATKTLSRLGRHQMQIINRLGATLSAFISPEMRSDAEWVSRVCIQAMDDFNLVNAQIINGDPVVDLDVYSHIICEHFGGVECDEKQCKSVATQKRVKERESAAAAETEAPAVSSPPSSTSSTAPALREMDRIHCAVLHAYQRGFKLYADERERMGKVADEHGNGDSDSNDYAHDYQTECLRRLLDSRPIDRGSTGADLRTEEEELHLQSKFVTQVVVEEEMEEEVEETNNGDGNQQRSAEVYYKFGYKFYYWEYFENNEEIDRCYNGGKDEYRVWFIKKKYASFKAELMNAGVVVLAFGEQNESGEQWMETEYVKGMKADFCLSDGDYDIARESPVSLPHLLSLLFHCNFTRLCTLFSCAFRKLRANETDHQLRERNAEFREFARLLVEMVHAFGAELADSNITVFFHGISMVMQFPSAVASFCSPTSTTVAFTVAINFAKDGMVLELENNKSIAMKFFDCSILSDFSNEDERLFIQGGYRCDLSDLSHTALSFHSIRLLHLNHNYRIFVAVISRLQRFIGGADVRQPFKTSKDQQNQKQCFEFLVSEKMVNDYKGDGRNVVPVYVRKMVDRVMEKMNEMRIYTARMNDSDYYLIFRDTFCDLYPAPEQQMDQKKKEQPICGVKWDFICSLMPNLKRIYLYRWPLSRDLMQSILEADWNGKCSQLRRIKFDEGNDVNEDARNKYRYNEMAAVYGERFEMKSLHFHVQFGEYIDIIRVNENENEQHGMSPVVEIIKGGDVEWERAVRYEDDDVHYYQRLFEHSFCLPPSSAASNPLFSNEFESFARILKCFDFSEFSNLLQEVFDCYTHFKWKQQQQQPFICQFFIGFLFIGSK